MIDPTGTYEVGGMPLNITADGPGWSINMAGVPEGFEPGMVRINDSAFRIVRGPFDGGIVAFNQDGSASIGPLPMGRVDGSYVEQIGSGLIAPPHADDPERDEAFADVLSGTPHGGRIEWTLQYPKHEFVRWAMDLDQFIFHSSNNTTIAEFVPIRTSVELQDHGERGNLGAVYGTHDGFWSMFFGVVDRKRVRGSIRNGVSRWVASDGRSVDTYQFSIHHECLPEHPYTTGAIYFLPRETFRRLPHYPGGPISDEWASEREVRPILSILIDPPDFPFLDRIGGHDDGPFLQMLKHFRVLVEAATSYERGEEGGLAIDINWTSDLDATFATWRAEAAVFMPTVNIKLTAEGETRTLSLRGPEAYEGQVASFLDETLDANSADR